MKVSTRAVLWIAVIAWAAYALLIGFDTADSAFSLDSVFSTDVSHAKRKILDAVARLIGFGALVGVLWFALCILVPEAKQRRSFEIQAVVLTCIAIAIAAIFLPGFTGSLGDSNTANPEEQQQPSTFVDEYDDSEDPEFIEEEYARGFGDV